jgi:NitT/TauT family transport system substrate-binding protein
MTRYLAGLAVALLVTGGASAAAAQAKTPVTILINFYATNEHAPFAYGIAKGIYAEEGIDLTVKEGSGSGATVNAIIADSARFGMADAAAVARAVSKDAPLRMIANFVQTSSHAIIFFADRGYRSLRDLVGKKVSFTAGDALHQNWPALIALAGIPRSDIQEVLLAPAAKQSAMITGTVDAMAGFYTSQAGVIERETGKKVAWISYADNGVNALTLGLFVHTKHATDRSLNCRMVRATSRAWAAAAADPDGAVDALHRMFPAVNKGARDLTKSQWMDTARHLYSTRSRGMTPGRMVKADWDDLIALLKNHGGMERARPVADYYTNEFFDCK